MSAAAPPQEEAYAFAKEPVFEQFGYEPHPKQRIIHSNGCRHRVAACGRRFGKSVIGGNELSVEALYTHAILSTLDDKRREFWIVGPEYSDSEKEFRVLYNTLKKLEVPFDRPGTYNNPETGDMVVSLWGGKFLCHAKSAKYPGTLVGEGLNGIVLAEAAKLKELVWTKYLRPTLADYRGWSLHASTPEGKNWFYRNWQRGQNPSQEQWASWRMPSWYNPIVFPDGRMDSEILDMEEEMSEERFNQEVGADFSEFVGRVFKDFDEEVHVGDFDYDQRYPVFLACDYGWTNPFVALVIQVDVWDNVYVLAEYRVTHKDINDIARDLATYPIIREKINLLYPDPAEPGDTAVLCKALKMKASGDTGGELKWRLELIRQRLKLLPEHVPIEQRKPRLFIDRSCTGMPLGDGGLIREMSDYRYPDTKEESLKAAPEAPLDKDDHGPEALGRFMRGHFGGPAMDGEKPRARVRKANMSRKAS